MTAIIIPNSNC